METWICASCGESHSGVPTGYSYDAPWTWYTVPEEERERRCSLSADYCVIDDSDFFVRGCLEIPIVGRDEPFIWGVWVSLSKTNFEREKSLADSPERIKEAPYFGWLSSRIEIYPDTAALKTNVHTRVVGVRPFVELQQTEHPLSQEQQNGLSRERLVQIAELVQHGWKHPDWNISPF